MTHDETRYTARSLGALCGVSERTVRFYVEEGLLPPPAGRGRGANFEAHHLTRLRLIRAMQQAGNELDVIRDYLAELETELKGSGQGLEGALAVWTGRNERAVWQEQWRKKLGRPSHVLRFQVAEGFELLVDAASAPKPERLQQIVRALREAVDTTDE
jgi:DNA-binding transcriptional MerR regulator